MWITEEIRTVASELCLPEGIISQIVSWSVKILLNKMFKIFIATYCKVYSWSEACLCLANTALLSQSKHSAGFGWNLGARNLKPSWSLYIIVPSYMMSIKGSLYVCNTNRVQVFGATKHCHGYYLLVENPISFIVPFYFMLFFLSF